MKPGVGFHFVLLNLHLIIHNFVRIIRIWPDAVIAGGWVDFRLNGKVLISAFSLRVIRRLAHSGLRHMSED